MAAAVEKVWTPESPIPPPPGWEPPAEPAPALTQAERVRWATALPGTPEGQRARTEIAGAHGGSRAVEQELDPYGLWMAENVLPMAPYALMGAVPGSLPLAAALGGREAIAGTIGAVTAKPGERGRGALTSMAAQTVGELAQPLVAAGLRIGGRAIDRMSDQITTRLMTEAKRLVPWWRGLPTTQKGFEALVTDEGLDLLHAEYGGAIRKALGSALKGEKIPVTAADAQLLKLAPRSPVYPNGSVLVSADEAAVAAQVLGAGSEVGQRVTGAVAALVSVLQTTKPEAAKRITDVLTGPALAAEKKLYAEGLNLVYSLRTMKALDPATKRLDPEALVKGVATKYGVKNPQTIWDRYLTSTKAPGARAAVRSLVPPGMVPPSRVPVPFIRHSGPLGSVGEALPFTLGSRNVPRTEMEQDVVRRLAPTVAGSLAQGGRAALTPGRAEAQEAVAPEDMATLKAQENAESKFKFRYDPNVSEFNQGRWPAPEEIAARDRVIREQVQKMKRDNPALYNRLPLLHEAPASRPSPRLPLTMTPEAPTPRMPQGWPWLPLTMPEETAR